MEPVAIILTLISALIEPLIDKAVTALLEEWAKSVGLGKEFITLQKELTKIDATVKRARGRQTKKNKDLPALLKGLQQLAYEAEDLLDELDYYRIQHNVDPYGDNSSSQLAHQAESEDLLDELDYSDNSSSQDDIELYAGNSSSQHAHQAEDLFDELDYNSSSQDVIELNAGNSSSQIPDSTGSSSSTSSALKLTSCVIRSPSEKACSSSAQNVVVQISISTMSNRMKNLVQQLRKTGKDVRKAMKHKSIVALFRAHRDKQATITNPREKPARMDERVYGRDQEQDNLLNLLEGDEAASRTLSVISIVGQGGVGKTTLAQLVYNDHKVKTHFFRMWVTVSVNFDVQTLTKKILDNIPSSNHEKIRNLDGLQATLERSLEEKRFFLVLDDLWEDEDTDSWELLLKPLKKGSTKGNVILITTRKSGVKKLDRSLNSISLDGLGENEYWSFFKACTEMNKGCINLEDIGREIVKKLKGNPLAAKTVGALLKRNLDASHWIGVLEREEWKRENVVDGIMPALRISYDHLPFHLQRCFSYCALFPKDYEFRPQELVNIWMSQGFLYVQGQRMEDVGNKYLDDLVDSGFLQTNHPKYEFGCVHLIHDLLHDLAQNVSFEECLSVDGRETQVILPGTRHLSILTEALYESDEIENEISVNNRFEKQLIEVEKHVEPRKLRTVMFFGDDDSINPKSLERFQSKFKDANGLRALRLDIIPNAQLLLSGLHNFTHLRYLKLCFEYSGRTLPAKICRLYHLQVLDVSQWKYLEKLPNNFNNLINLRHFIPYHEKSYSLIAGVGKLAQLQELLEFRVRKGREFAIEQLRELKDLRGELSIYNLENVKSTEEAKGAGLIEKTLLNSLNLSWDGRENSDVGQTAHADVLESLQPHRNLNELKITGYGGATTPTWLTNLHLKDVSLVECMAWKILPPLGQQLSLKRLKLESMSIVSEIGSGLYGCGQHMAFQCLEVMILEDMPKLAKWIWNGQCQNLPALSELSIINCPELDLLLSNCASEAEFNKWFPNLVKLRISECPKLLQLPPLPWNNKISTICIDNARSFKSFSFSNSELSIIKPNNPGAWDDIRFHNLVTITSLRITSNRYPLSWENLCSLASLKKLHLQDSPVLFSFPNNGPNDKKFLQLTFLESLMLWSCGITGKQLSWILQHVPVLSELEIRNCHKIKSIEVETKMNEPNSITSSVVELGEDEGFLQIPSSLTSLETLEIRDCPDMVNASKGGLSGLVSIQILEIQNCNRLLASMMCGQPISKANLLPPKLQQLTMSNVPEGTSQLLEGLSSLTYLYVSGGPELKSFDLTSCTALETLNLWDCQKLASLKGLESLARLKQLIVRSCPGFADAWISASDIEFLMPLESLKIDSTAVLVIPICNQLTSLQHLTFVGEDVDLTEEQVKSLLLLTSLKVITFSWCTNLRHLPTNLHLLTSVEKLIIYDCEEIQSLPENGLPKSLKKIVVSDSGGWVKNMFEEYESQLKKEDSRGCVFDVRW